MSLCQTLFPRTPDPTGSLAGHRGPSLRSLAPRFPMRSIPSTHAESVHVAIPIKANYIAEGPGSAAFISLPGRGLCKLSPRLTD